MLDPKTATFDRVDDADTRTTIVVGQLGTTEALSIDQRAFGHPADLNEAVEDAKAALLVRLWFNAYGRIGGIVQHLKAEAIQNGDLRYLVALQDAWVMLNPTAAVPAPAPSEPEPTPPRGANEWTEAVDAFIDRLLVRLKAHGIDLGNPDGDDEPAEILAQAIAEFIVTSQPLNRPQS